jgi:hypothetical protein
MEDIKARNSESNDDKHKMYDHATAQSVATKYAHVSAATDKHILIEKLLEVVISIRFVPKL